MNVCTCAVVAYGNHSTINNMKRKTRYMVVRSIMNDCELELELDALSSLRGMMMSSIVVLSALILSFLMLIMLLFVLLMMTSLLFVC
jgi:hypothetical protein